MAVTITVYRGTAQIGGCCTEIRTDTTRILVDIGQELTDNEKEAAPLLVEGVTFGKADCEGVFFTHYHGDHIGLYDQILPGIPLYMGAAAREIFAEYQQRISGRYDDDALSHLKYIRQVYPARQIHIGNITVTPIAVDHSAYDSYMYLVEAESMRILHTGDFRLHGFRGKGVLPALNKYVGQVDVIIMEGTTLSRVEKVPRSETELEREAIRYMQDKKYVFALCSSTNIDRLAALAAAAKKAHRLFICDAYQKKVLDIAASYGRAKSAIYDFSDTLVYGGNLLPLMQKKGFCMAVRATERFREIMEQFDRQESLILYSMWSGYRERDKKLMMLLEGAEWLDLHTSGHADASAIKAVCEAVSPRRGVIPIHTESPERFDEVCSPYPVIRLRDGEAYVL